jgi:hypothetical protein
MPAAVIMTPIHPSVLTVSFVRSGFVSMRNTSWICMMGSIWESAPLVNARMRRMRAVVSRTAWIETMTQKRGWMTGMPA